MQEFLWINKALQSIQGELVNDTSKLTEIDKRIKMNSKKLEEVENDPNTEKQARLEILSRNQKDLQTQVARIKQTLENVLNKDTFLAERIRVLFCEQRITTFSILTAFSITIATIPCY